MSKRFLFTILILSGLVVSLVTGVCFADALAQLEKFETYKWHPPQAEAIYQEIARDYPGSSYALTAHKNLIISYRSAKRHDDVQQALDELVKDFSGHPGLPAVLYDIARIYERTKKYEKAAGIYQQIIQQYPDSLSAEKVQLAGPRIAVLSHIELKDDDAAAAATDKLIADSAGHSELPMSLYDIARRYERAKKHDKAASLYQQIIQRYPESSAADRAQLAIKRIDVMLIIESGEPNAVQAAIDGLIADYPDHQDMSEALFDIAERGYERGRTPESYERAKGLYQQIIDQFPNSSHAARARLLVPKMDILSSIRTGQYEQADVLAEKLVADFAGHSYVPAVLVSVASEYERLAHYQRAKDIRQKITQQYQETSHARESLLNVVKSQALIYLDTGEHSKVLATVDKLIADFNNHPHSPWAVSWIAARYYEKSRQLRLEGLDIEANDHLVKAITICEKVIQKLPESTTTPAVYHLSGVCYQELGEYEKAIEQLENMVNNWPDYKNASQAQYLVACCYEELEKAGRISTADAAVKITQACEKLLADYPTSTVATAAQALLEKWSSKEY